MYNLHTDHLGTASFVTDDNSETNQFFLNLPFGETMLEQMDRSYNNPYKFNAKELDEDIGLYYYGARYYDPRLSIWYGVDPLAEKYSSLSPYVYVADNPIKYIDPDGKEIVIPTTLDKSDRNKILKNLRGLTNDKISYNETNR
jgi:RHS repeat-associated protein